MTVFQSQLEQLMPAQELLFDSTPGFGRYKPYMEQAIAHPAKMNTKLLEFLIKAHTKEGDVVLDPMSGSGSTGIVSALNGRNAICVELEQKFYGWIEEARRKVESSTTLSSKGNIVNIKGDARQLSKLLVKADVVLTSPPYAETQAFQDVEFMKKIQQNQNEKLRKGEIKGHSKTEVAAVREFEKIQSGKIENPDNIGNLGFVDSVITSPPYEQSLEGGTRHYQKGGGHFKIIDDKHLPTAYSFQNENQIGNLKKETYLEAMLKVYSEMWKVLKPEGSAIIVIKPFIRNKKVVDLPWHTWLLLEKVGFKLSKVYKLRLKQDSFWRVLYKQKYPDVPQIKHEYIIVCQKSPSFYG